MNLLFRYSPIVGLLVLSLAAVLLELFRDATCQQDKTGACNELFSSIAFILSALMVVISCMACVVPQMFGTGGRGGGGSS